MNLMFLFNMAKEYTTILARLDSANNALVGFSKRIRDKFRYIIDIHTKYETHLAELEALINEITAAAESSKEKIAAAKKKAEICINLLDEIEKSINAIVELSKFEQWTVLVEEAGELETLKKAEHRQEAQAISRALRNYYNDLRIIIRKAKMEIKDGIKPERNELKQIKEGKAGIWIVPEAFLKGLTSILGRGERTEKTKLQHTLALFRYSSIKLKELDKKENEDLRRLRFEITNLETVEKKLKEISARITAAFKAA
jgi:hypothetical protein